ncbi:DUF1045 domain-containing protein [Sneathiella limimaris]|uniref:DUF1045 domain-containing protein n=1 Tax=Sneathiella limimaris TaxID=1964213 RepID=UPI00146CAC89|nr:DUF1045 domain-containing protein [Sneathiella limimaris]
MTDFERYALYYAPERGSLLARLGNGWLGRDPETGECLETPHSVEISEEEFKNYIVSPKRYGFHGTLKAPFRLKPGVSQADLETVLERFATSTGPVTTAPLKLRQFKNFTALVPGEVSEDLSALAFYCVKELEPFRAPLASYELERRRQVDLSPRQEQHLQDWGYPYVLDEFRFHLTLTGEVPERKQPAMENLVAKWFAAILQDPFVIREVCLFGDPGGGLPFKLVQRYGLQGAAVPSRSSMPDTLTG